MNPVSRRRPSATQVILSLVVGAIVLFAAPSAAVAHEFGPFAIDRYAAIRVAPDELQLDYVLSLAETPTQADGDSIEADPDAYCASLLDELDIVVDGSPVEFADPVVSVLREDGDGGLTTLRVGCDWTAPLDPTTDARSIELDDANYEGRVGWREIIVVGDSTEISGEVRDSSLTERLTDYPDPDENPEESSVSFDALASPDAEPASLPSDEPGDEDGGGDAFSDLIADADGGLGAQAVALAFAAFLGALHSLAPGHGKTVIGAYLVGTRGTKLQAFVLAIAVALSHTLGVLILGLITYAAGAAFAPENVYPWLQGLSALIVLGIGIWLVVTARKEYRLRTAQGDGHEHHDHAEHEHHDHVHHGHADHEHEQHAHEHHEHHEHAEARNGHEDAHVEHEIREAAVALVSGSAAVADTLDHDHHDHPHDHDHDHDHEHGAGWHRHGIFPHTHRFDLDEMDLSGKVSWKTLAVLGLSGGLVPSTSAIIVLLGAIQLNRIAFGGLLILAFGVGMAIALVSVGLGMVALRDKAFGAMDGNSMIRAARIWVVPIAAIAVLAIGIFLVIRALIEIGGI